MNNQMNSMNDVVAIYFAGVVKTGVELREVIRQLNATKLYDLTEEECEYVARWNEATQGVKLFD